MLWAELVAGGRGLTELSGAWGQGGEQIRGSRSTLPVLGAGWLAPLSGLEGSASIFNFCDSGRP